MQELIQKVLDIDKLPTHTEVNKLIWYWFEDIDRWSEFIDKNPVYNIYNVEFVDALANEIKKANENPVIEICAGNGKLSYHLRERGIDIISTDDYSWGFGQDKDLIERLSHKEALKKYNPKVVIGAWIPGQTKPNLDILEWLSQKPSKRIKPNSKLTRIGFDVLDYPSVSYFFDIGEVSPSPFTWMTKEALQRKDFEVSRLRYMDKYCFSRADFIAEESKSKVTLFKRK